jgi:hypothetical protein
MRFNDDWIRVEDCALRVDGNTVAIEYDST